MQALWSYLNKSLTTTHAEQCNHVTAKQIQPYSQGERRTFLLMPRNSQNLFRAMFMFTYGIILNMSDLKLKLLFVLLMHQQKVDTNQILPT